MTAAPTLVLKEFVMSFGFLCFSLLRSLSRSAHSFPPSPAPHLDEGVTIDPNG